VAGYTGHVFKLKDSAVKRFSDFAEEEGPLEGGKVQIDSILSDTPQGKPCGFCLAY
jgi:hypothetical protein